MDFSTWNKGRGDDLAALQLNSVMVVCVPGWIRGEGCQLTSDLWFQSAVCLRASGLWFFMWIQIPLSFHLIVTVRSLTVPVTDSQALWDIGDGAFEDMTGCEGRSGCFLVDQSVDAGFLQNVISVSACRRSSTLWCFSAFCCRTLMMNVVIKRVSQCSGSNRRAGQFTSHSL